MTVEISNSRAPENLVTLLVNGSEYGGWKNVRIECGIERQARSFDLDITQKWPGKTEIAQKILPGDLCQVFIGKDLVLTGFVDATPIRYDGNALSVGIKGRSKTADLVDCCPVPNGEKISKKVVQSGGADSGKWKDVVGKDGAGPSKKTTVVTVTGQTANQWKNQKLEVIAAALASPYGIKVLTEVDTGKPLAEHHIDVGESCFESIQRMMQARHVLSTDNEFGDLVFVNVGSGGRSRTPLVLGENVLEADADLDYTGVFSEYIVKGQKSGGAKSDAEGEGKAFVDRAVAKDGRSPRRRVLVIKQSGQADEGTCQDRAEYERAHRAAKALETNYVVRGWRRADGTLWKQNELVHVQDPLIGFNNDMLIAEVHYTLGNDGLRTELRVGPIDGYRPQAGKTKEEKRKTGGGKDWSDVK